MDFTIPAVTLNRVLNRPQDKIIVRHIASGSLIALDSMTEFKHGTHRLLQDEEPKAVEPIEPQTINIPEDSVMQELTPDEQMWTDPETGKSFKTEAALKAHYTRTANAQQTN
jgi:hypothetical protein